MTLRNQSKMLAAAAAAAVVVAASATAAQAYTPILPVACTILKPIIKSAKKGRELTGEEITASTLMCWTGPIGYVISVRNGWIEPHPLLTSGK